MAEHPAQPGGSPGPSTRETLHRGRRSGTRFYDIEADWTLMTTCNYRCEYCFWTPDDLGRRISPPAPIDKLASFFDETGLIWLLHLTGGEPFLYPDFIELCGRLTRSHWISINTNADNTPLIERFVEATDPERVLYINAGLHIEQRELRRRVDAFLANIHIFHSNGFKVFASSVMHPQVILHFATIWNRCADEGVVVVPKAFQGEYCGRAYPQSYSEEERDLFRHYSTRAAQAYSDMFSTMLEPPTVNPLLDAERFLRGFPDYRGTACDAGYRFVRIRSDGEIRRCGAGDVLGNVATGLFNRRTGAATCEWIECAYFCEKYVRPA